MMQYESKDDAGHKFWTARYGRYAVRIDANIGGSPPGRGHHPGHGWAAR
jgi:hypothetical protein